MLLGDKLGQHFREAVHYARSQRHSHVEFSATFSEEQLEEWRTSIADWYADSSNPDPFQEPVPGTLFVGVLFRTNIEEICIVFVSEITLNQVRRELTQEEEREFALGATPLHDVSLSRFLITGLELVGSAVSTFCLKCFYQELKSEI